MCSLKLCLVIFGTALSVCWAKSVEDELTVTYRLVTFNYSTASNEVHAGEEVCSQELLSNMTKKYLMYMDKTVDPCDNFYRYACGNFGKFHPVSDVKHETFVDDILEKRLEEMIATFLEQPLAENYDLNDAETKARVFYKSCLDTDTIRQRGFQPLKEFIGSLGGWEVLDHPVKEDSFDLVEVLGKLTRLGAHILIGIMVDYHWSDEVNDVILILPGDSFLSKRKCSNSSDLAKLKKFFEEVLVLSGVPSDVAKETSEDTANFELQITKLQFDPLFSEREQNLTLEELQSQIPSIDWSQLLTAVFDQELSPQQKVRLRDSEYITGLSNLLQETSKRTLANYVFLKAMMPFAPIVEAGFENIENDFRNFTKPSFEKLCAKVTRDFFSTVLDGYFAQNYFKKSKRDEVAKLAEQLRKTFARTIEENGWVDTKTKELLQNLLRNMVLQIGLRDEKLSKSSINKKYRDVKIIPDRFFESLLNVLERAYSERLQQLNKKPENDYLDMVPTTTQAFYDPVKNEALISSSILHPPNYHTHFPRPINFGAIGFLLGHEIAHAFDNNGTWTQADVTRYSNWTKTSMLTFDKLAECFVHQYDNYNIYNMSLNGTATLEENIADTTGLQMAYRAYLEELAQNPSEDNLTLPKLNMTDKQLFFLSFAHSWCSASSETAMNRTIQYGSHSPQEFRIVGALSNTIEFAEAFNCSVGSNMNPSNKCVIW